MDQNALQDRQKFIGGSDAPAVLGLSRWQTPLGLWAEKTGMIVKDQETTLAQELGQMLEETVAKLFMKRTGKVVRRANERRVHPRYPFLCAQIDRLVVGEDAILECKTASGWKAKEWEGEEIPQEYIIQVMHGLAVTGRKRGYIAVLIGNQDFKYKVIDRDEEMIRQMIQQEVSFWNNFVLPKVMPGIITKNDAPVLYELFPMAEAGATIEFGDEEARLIESRNALIQDKTNVEGQIDKIENELKAKMKTYEYAKAGDWIISWKDQVTRRFDSEEFRTLHPDLYEQFKRPCPSRVFRARKQNG